MSREYPDWLDPFKAAEGKREFAGTMPLSRMDRLVLLLAESDGNARFQAGFDLDGQGTVRIEVEVEAELGLQCQASLKTFWLPVKRQSVLGVIENLADESGLPVHYEPVLVEDSRIAMIDLVEDELLLAVPQIPRDPALKDLFQRSELDQASAKHRTSGQTRQPFADLAEQMKKHAQDVKKP